MITATTVVRVKEGKHVFSKTGEDVVIMGVETGRYYSLNPVGACFWEAIQDPISIADAAGRVTAAFEVAQETAEADLMELAGQLVAADLVEVVSASAS